ncbi:putative glycoside hydrolase [Alkalihalobacterium chitinilyticum]|uniref:Glycoside hydrolase n=1 Tax=Alkalihalobacterium chitinilyticum TaxID=2980103 RepID=A0ABT5VD17_9BACI|nr:putative glycoside hydrolase [Alkalihalobacterium chitinilyticum]MDE5412632.1 putative glycoside hydrolase [Alkalihalobacterium chitinilyticum]
MGKKLIKLLFIKVVVFSFFVTVQEVHAEGNEGKSVQYHSAKEIVKKDLEFPDRMARFVFDSGFTFQYPDAVRGIYVTGNSAGGERMNSLLELIDSTELNAMVIDIKDDHGYLTYKPEDDSPFYYISQNYIKNTEDLMKTLEEKQIYPIARIVVFKDTVLAEKKPELSFKTADGKVWKNRRGEAFVNPFLKEVWDYNVAIAEKAAKMGFKEIQFDYVRFPEGFERRDEDLKYSVGEYEGGDGDNVQKRVTAVADFVAYAREQLAPYDVDVSVDIFGYAATIPEAPGIGQNFLKISENVDVISSMIYPSHWTSYFGIDKPDLYPYELVDAYAKVENELLGQLDTPPVSRPWIQDFTASWLGAGNYKSYGKDEVEAQIKALNDNGINEYLLWNASNRYTQGVNYTP